MCVYEKYHVRMKNIMCALMSTHARRPQVQELQVVGTHTLCVLETKFVSSGKAASAISLISIFVLFLRQNLTLYSPG